MSSAVKNSVYVKPASNPSGAEAPDPVINRFLDAVWMERGLSANTLAAYRADLTALGRWLDQRDIPQRPARFHRLARRGGGTAALYRAATLELPALFPLPGARRDPPR
jgi:hypothetical protein